MSYALHVHVLKLNRVELNQELDFQAIDTCTVVDTFKIKHAVLILEKVKLPNCDRMLMV